MSANNIPKQKHPFDQDGKVLVNKEWYLALVSIVSSVNSSTLSQSSVADVSLLVQLDTQVDSDVDALRKKVSDLEKFVALLPDTQDPVITLVDEKGSGGTPGFAAGVDFTAGTSTTLTLSRGYKTAAALWVSFDGAVQGADQFSLIGKVLTFTSAIPVGTSKVFVKGLLQT